MLSLLAIETSTEACSAALYYDEKITFRFEIAPQQHAALILNFCEELLNEASLLPSQLSAITFGRGPGSFTGVRIATAVAQGMAIAHDLPIIPISTLQALAQEAYIKTGHKKIIAGLDARMNEIYRGKFVLENDVMILIDQELIIKKDNIQIEDNWFYAGTAFQEKDIFYPSANALLKPALKNWHENKILPAEMALPVYLRDNVTF
jgi:tRNA threonylcarbamoyladenosine biosynthesis protein TsaB